MTNIQVQFNMGTENYELWISDSRLRPMPAGPRLFRAPPIPDIRFTHAEIEAAMIDAGKLRKYLAGVGKDTKG